VTTRAEGADAVRVLLAAIAGELPKALERAQNKMIYQVWHAEKDQMRKDIDRPTPFSINSLQYKKVGPPKPLELNTDGAAVYMANAFKAGNKVGPDEYLGVQILGGLAAGPKRSERIMQARGWMPQGTTWVPASGVSLNQYGNISGGLMSAMLTNLGANPYGNKKDPKKEKTLFVLIGQPGREEGVFRLVGREWRPFLWFVKRPTYRARYTFHERGASEIGAQYPAILSEALAEALNSRP
jgi:hypothetical protein